MHEKLETIIQQDKIVDNYLTNNREKIYSTIKNNKTCLERNLHEIDSVGDNFERTGNSNFKPPNDNKLNSREKEMLSNHNIMTFN